VQVLFHSWYNAPQTAAAASRFDEDQYHGSWLENFPWTRVAGAEIPAGSAPVLSRAVMNTLTPKEMKDFAPDGSLGGAYQRSDEDMQVVWDAGVAEVRELLEKGWRQP
jgi:creatinine amidohydrolase